MAITPPVAKKSFVLIELLVIMALVVFLASVVIIFSDKAVQKSRRAKAAADVKKIGEAAMLLAADTGKFPHGCPSDSMADPELPDLNLPQGALIQPPPAGFDPDGAGPCRWTAEDVAEWHGPYTTSVPVDPWGFNYIFDPDYLGKTGTYPPFVGCPSKFKDGSAVHSLGPDGLFYTCDDVPYYLLVLP